MSLLGSVFTSRGIFFSSVLAWFFAWLFLQPLDQYNLLLFGRFIRWYYFFLSFWGWGHVEGWIIIIMPRIVMVLAAWVFRVSAFLGYLSHTQWAEVCTMRQLKAVWPCSAWHWAQANISCLSAGPYRLGADALPSQQFCIFCPPWRVGKAGLHMLAICCVLPSEHTAQELIFSWRFHFLMGKAAV